MTLKTAEKEKKGKTEEGLDLSKRGKKSFCRRELLLESFMAVEIVSFRRPSHLFKSQWICFSSDFL